MHLGPGRGHDHSTYPSRSTQQRRTNPEWALEVLQESDLCLPGEICWPIVRHIVTFVNIVKRPRIVFQDCIFQNVLELKHYHLKLLRNLDH